MAKPVSLELGPLDGTTLEQLLVPHEVVKDPVNQDITITALERRIIDTQTFQRLRLLYQLGPTHLVYPGAVHTRFLHSLGTLHWVEQLIRIVNRNYTTYGQPTLLPVENYPRFLARLCALLHDVAHMPFGHTLEDEGNLAQPEWNDKARSLLWLGPDSEIGKAILKFLTDSKVASTAAEKVYADIRAYVLHKGNPMELDYPFVLDLVGNTLCADLLDYLDRDMYFCGLREKSGDRFIQYAAVMRIQLDNTGRQDGDLYFPSLNPDVSKGRVVLLTYRYEREHLTFGKPRPVFKTEIIPEAIDLLRRRLALAEKVYFHRTKLAASAMLISAMESASLQLKDIYNLSDSEFVSKLTKEPDLRTKNLASAYAERRLYKPIFILNYKEEQDSDPLSKKLWGQDYPQFRDPNWRRSKEDFLEKFGELPPGSVSIYCPDRNMNLKEFDMLVESQPDGEIKKLGAILDHSYTREMGAIKDRFLKLWRLLIFVDPEILDVNEISNPKIQDFNALCEGVIGYSNDILTLRGKGQKLREQVAHRAIASWQKNGNGEVPYDVFPELVNAKQRSEGMDLVVAVHQHLESIMKSRQQQRLIP